MNNMKRMIIMGMVGILQLFPMRVEAASCAGGAGIELKGNDHGTYCISATKMNWWSAHAWCDAIGMKLVPMEECECKNESKCDMTMQCPNLGGTYGIRWGWTTTPNGSANAYQINFNNGTLRVEGRNKEDGGQDFLALCMP